VSGPDRLVEYLPLDGLVPATRNPKAHAHDTLRASIGRFGYTAPALLDERTGRLVAGHGRTQALAAMRAAGEHPPAGVQVGDGGAWLVPVVRGWASRSDAEADAYLVADNQLTIAGGWDDSALEALLADLTATDPDLTGLLGFSDEQLAGLLEDTAGGGPGDGTARGDNPSLADRFLVPPFDVLNASAHWWRERKVRWLSLGIQSELGRQEQLVFDSPATRDPGRYDDGPGRPTTGTSTFDPVLCELVVRWFSAAGGQLLDPFAGGSVRGVVAATLGRAYLGCDLSEAQVQANEGQAEALAGRGVLGGPQRPLPQWVTDNAAEWVWGLEPGSADLLFTCPPYYGLERYSDDPADLSTMGYAAFDTALEGILAGAARALRPDRFAVVVTGDVRDAQGVLHDLRGATIAGAGRAGLAYVTGGVLATTIGSAKLLAARAFLGTRNLWRTHQDVLVFVKGNRGRAAQACGTVEVHMPEPQPGDDEPAPDDDGGAGQ
jgi:hypothetical protein